MIAIASHSDRIATSHAEAADRHFELLDAKSLRQSRASADLGVGARGHVEETAADAAARVIVRLGAHFETRGAARVSDARREPRLDERAEDLVHGLQAEIGNAAQQAIVDLVRGRMPGHLLE